VVGDQGVRAHSFLQAEVVAGKAGIDGGNLRFDALAVAAVFPTFGSSSFKPRFRTGGKSISLIPGEIAQDLPCGYWEHPDQFVGPGL
jgi:hypothetical protein